MIFQSICRMDIYINPSRDRWAELTSRKRNDDSSIDTAVREIINAVKTGGDKALIELAERIDKARLGSTEVSREEMYAAISRIPEKLKEAMDQAAENIRRFHKAQIPEEISIETMPGVRCVSRPVPISNVGLYIPGGSAPLFSTVLMLAVPAETAGCRQTVLCTPPDRNGTVSPSILYAAHICGIRRIFKAGGAQAIAAMAYGTETIPRVDKIFGPGNRYVTRAKQMLSSEVAIDMPAGPSEVMVLADSTARPEFIASDLLSQAEHGPDSQVMLVCTSAKTAGEVREETARQLENLPRKDIAIKSLDNSRIIVMDSLDDIIDFANSYAPEHLIISMDRPWDIASRITAAGSIFIGNYSPESAGDYASGTNHTLPTSGWARSYSGVNTESFFRRMTIQELTYDGLSALGDTIMEMASEEGLEAHRRAVEIRLGQRKTTGTEKTYRQ